MLPDITKLGHVLLEVPNCGDVCAWYTGRFGLSPATSGVLPDGSPAAAFFRLDLGDKPADHHTLALTIHFMAGYGHSAFEVVDADAVGMGQRILQKKKWRHAGARAAIFWEVRSSIIGKIHGETSTSITATEDVFTAALPTEVHAVSREAMAQGGLPMPERFTRPHFALKSLVMLVRNLFVCERSFGQKAHHSLEDCRLNQSGGPPPFPLLEFKFLAGAAYGCLRCALLLLRLRRMGRIA